jgi:NAD(P)-dependent dehydrogenase (short-subunit alcohol dehydrogenase family)
VDYDLSGLGFRRGDVLAVTGAASGIGRATATLAARAGLTVACWDVDDARLDAAVAEIRSAGGAAQAVHCDVTRPDQVAAAWAATARLGPPRFLASNAGPSSAARLTLEEGLTLAAGSMAAVTEHWLAGHGEAAESVVFTASVSGIFGATPNGAAWYSAAKAAITAYAREIAVHRKGRPRANVVAPGVTITPRTARLSESETGRRMAARVPLGRLGTAAELAAPICFLLSPAASYVNGAVLPVDGAAHWVP